MKSIVITGSTKGIGRGLAEAFGDLGCRICVSGRSAAAVEQAVAELSAGRAAGTVAGQACDVRDEAQIRALWDAAAEAFGSIDVWINNAGVAHRQEPLWELSAEEITAVVETNLLGTIYGSQVAFRRMRRQGGGAIFNLEGLGSQGPILKGVAIYSATKAAITRLTRTLAAEAKGTPVIVGRLMPGMVLTDLLLGEGEERERRLQRGRKFFNLMAQPVDEVAPFLAKGVLACKRNGTQINYATPPRILARAARALLTGRDVISRPG